MYGRRVVYFLSLLLAGGVTNGHTADGDARQVFAAPLSLKTGMISASEANGLAQLGTAGFTEYVIKPVPGIAANIFRKFDNSLVICANGGRLSPSALQTIRTLVADGAHDNGFDIVEPRQSQAGIASILSPFRAPSGRVTWELMLVVFNRDKLQLPDARAGQSALLEAIYKSAVRGIVVHLYPETDLDLAQETLDSTTHDGLRKLISRGMTDFMKPLAAATPSSSPPREP